MNSYMCLGLGVITALLWHIIIANSILILSTLCSITLFIWLKSRKRKSLLHEAILYLLLFCSSYSYTTWRVNATNDHLITEAIPQIELTGYIATPPVKLTSINKSEFTITSGSFTGSTFLLYYPESQIMRPGINYNITTSLVPINISHNAGAFDYQQYLVNNHISGFAYFKKINATLDKSYALSALITSIRVDIINYLATTLATKEYMGLIVALICGYQSLIPDAQWQVFKNSGIIHLISISGLHITLVATLATLIAGYGLRYFPSNRIPRQIIMLWIGLTATLIYSLVAGFSIPTQRTFYLLLVSAYLSSLRIYIPLLQKLSITACVVLLVDPLAGLSSSFWLSFSLVAAIFAISGAYQKYQSKLQFWLTMQLAIILVSLPLSLYLFYTYPVISPLANLWAVPIIGTLITPILLIAALLHFKWLLLLLAELLRLAMYPVTKLAVLLPYSQAAPNMATVLLSYTGLFILFMPKSIPYKNIFGLGLFCCLFAIPNKYISYGHMEITAFASSKSGLSLISTHDRHILVYVPYETKNQEKNLENTLIPYLHAQHISKIDSIITNGNIESSFSRFFANNQIELKNHSYEGSSNIIDGISINVDRNNQNLEIEAKDINNQTTYIGNGYNRQVNQTTHWKTVVIMAYPWISPDWIYETQIDNLILGYPNKAKNKVGSIKNNLNLNANNIHDTNMDGSTTIN